jgi:hypothetical protein
MLELSSVCVVDTQGKIVKEAKVASDPEDLIAFFASLGFAVKRGSQGRRIRSRPAGDAIRKGVVGNDCEDRP